MNFNLAETIRGGEMPYAFSGTVPTGLTLNPNGTLSGSVATAGSYPFTLRVTDATAAAVAAKDAIKITAITFNALGEPVLMYPPTYKNGQVVLQGSASLSTPFWHDGRESADRFFKTVLRLQ